MALEGLLDLLAQLNEKIAALEKRPPQQIVVQPRPALLVPTPTTNLIQEQVEPVEYDEPAPTPAPIADRPRPVKVRRTTLWKMFD
jgi:hypothetical protein